MPKYKCLGCKDECEMDWPVLMTGCTYEDGVYPKNAAIWFPKESVLEPQEKEVAKKTIQEVYPEEWKQEEH